MYLISTLIGIKYASSKNMRHGTSIPFLQRKLKLSYQRAKELIESLVSQGILNTDPNYIEEPNPQPKLTFEVQSKYGRDLFYPICDNSKLIVCKLLHQKTATIQQLKTMQEHGWLVEYSYKKIEL